MSTPLRTLMLNQMTLRYLAEKTKTAYISAVAGLAKFYMQSPDQLTEDQVQRYLLYLIEERKLAWSTCNVAFSAFRFLYYHCPQTTGWGLLDSPTAETEEAPLSSHGRRNPSPDHSHPQSQAPSAIDDRLQCRAEGKRGCPPQALAYREFPSSDPG